MLYFFCTVLNVLDKFLIPQTFLRSFFAPRKFPTHSLTETSSVRLRCFVQVVKNFVRKTRADPAGIRGTNKRVLTSRLQAQVGLVVDHVVLRLQDQLAGAVQGASRPQRVIQVALPLGKRHLPRGKKIVTSEKVKHTTGRTK